MQANEGFLHEVFGGVPIIAEEPGQANEGTAFLGEQTGNQSVCLNPRSARRNGAPTGETVEDPSLACRTPCHDTFRS